MPFIHRQRYEPRRIGTSGCSIEKSDEAVPGSTPALSGCARVESLARGTCARAMRVPADYPWVGAGVIAVDAGGRRPEHTAPGSTDLSPGDPRQRGRRLPVGIEDIDGPVARVVGGVRIPRRYGVSRRATRVSRTRGLRRQRCRSTVRACAGVGLRPRSHARAVHLHDEPRLAVTIRTAEPAAPGPLCF